jgi:nitrite reductase/ring-hydroxylating ferredoxin subunit
MAMAQDKSVSASLIHRADLPEQGIIAVDAVIDGEMESIIVQCVGDQLRAWFNACPHEGRRLDYAPGKFLLDKDRLVCAAHGACFRLVDGECVSGPCRGESLRPVAIAEEADGRLRFGPANPPGNARTSG